MKKTVLFFLFSVFAINGFSQPVVYVNFLSHNEETSSWNNLSYYTINRSQLVSLTNYFQANGISWNLQSDWVYLTNVLTKETTALMASTNNKNILVWMQRDKGVELDPHAHESQYIYSDVVKLMDSVGLVESKLIGGTIYNDSNGINIWTNLVNGQYGKKFPSKFWKPDYMMGGGTPNHVADLKYYGFWNPQSPANYLTNDTSSHLRHIGVGCEIKINDTSTVAEIVAEVQDVIQKVKSGQYPANGFYLQTIFFEQSSLNNAPFYNMVTQIADSVNAMVAAGDAQWKTLKQTYSQWETAYNAQMFQWECGALTSVLETNIENNIKVYPNPASDKIKFDISKMNNGIGAEVNVYNVFGDLVGKSVLADFSSEIDVRLLPRGIYFYQIRNELALISTGKILLQ